MPTQRYEVTQPHGGTLLGWAASEHIARVAGPGTGPTMAKRWTWYRRDAIAEVVNFVTRGTGRSCELCDTWHRWPGESVKCVGPGTHQLSTRCTWHRWCL
jgi:hypothetical protein